jgi:DNA-binding NtrC family response regulator
MIFLIHPSSLILHPLFLSRRAKVDRKDIRILVVDDEMMMADSLKQNLVEEGFTVDTASAGAEAIELFDRGGHHVAICDVQLPDMDGLEVLRHIKDTQPSTEVIVMTGYGSVQRAIEATKAGAFWFLEKPFEFEVLLPLIERAVSTAN